MIEVGGSPIYHRATLIQAFSGFLGELSPHLNDVMHEHGLGKDHLHAVLKWILAEELWLCYLMSDHTHQRNHGLYATIHQEVAQRLQFDLSACFTNYFFVPDVDRGYAIEVEVSGVGFFIRYYTNEIQPMARVLKNEPINQEECSIKYLRAGIGGRI